MNYKLAKQLKDAGFPQDKARLSYVFPPKYPKGYINVMEVAKPQGIMNLLSAGYDIIACPTLEELIDACGDGFSALERWVWNKKWVARSKGNKTIGKTPSEAVAKLWLKSNK